MHHATPRKFYLCPVRSHWLIPGRQEFRHRWENTYGPHKKVVKKNMLDPTYRQDYEAVGGEGIEDFEEVEEIENPRKRQKRTRTPFSPSSPSSSFAFEASRHSTDEIFLIYSRAQQARSVRAGRLRLLLCMAAIREAGQA